MGREASIEAQLGDTHGSCTVYLEAEALVLRGAIKAKLKLAELSGEHVQANGLHANTPQGALWLGLTERVAQSWLLKMCAPTPTLASKLGIRAQIGVAFLQPDAEIEALVKANNAVFSDLAQANLWFKSVYSAADLHDLLVQLQKTPLTKDQSLWVIRLKGKATTLKESAVMQELRANGLVPTKTASVSELRTGDRYSLIRGA